MAVKKQILIIDDEEPIREYLRFGLENAGYSVLEAEDGEKGLLVLKNNMVNLVITDIVMPEKEGVETISDINAMYPDCKIIAMTGAKFGETYLKIVRKFNVLSTVQKPFQVEDLVVTVNNILKT